MGESEKRAARKGAIQHLEAALEAEEREETDYHVKEALQLLGLDAYSDEDR